MTLAAGWKGKKGKETMKPQFLSPFFLSSPGKGGNSTEGDSMTCRGERGRKKKLRGGRRGGV